MGWVGSVWVDGAASTPSVKTSTSTSTSTAKTSGSSSSSSGSTSSSSSGSTSKSSGSSGTTVKTNKSTAIEAMKNGATLSEAAAAQSSSSGTVKSNTGSSSSGSTSSSLGTIDTTLPTTTTTTPKAGAVVNGTTPTYTSDYKYTLNTSAGNTKYNEAAQNGSADLGNGDTLYRASDGSVYVKTKNGSTYAVQNNWTSSSAPTVTSTSYKYTVTTSDGNDVIQKAKSTGTVQYMKDGTAVYVGNDGNVYAQTKSGNTYAVDNQYGGNSAVTDTNTNYGSVSVDFSSNSTLANEVAKLQLGITTGKVYDSSTGNTYELDASGNLAVTGSDGVKRLANIVSDYSNVKLKSSDLSSAAIRAKAIQLNMYDTSKSISYETDADGDTASLYEITTSDNKSYVCDASGNQVKAGTRVSLSTDGGRPLNAMVFRTDTTGSTTVASIDASSQAFACQRNSDGQGINYLDDVTNLGLYVDSEGRTFNASTGNWIALDSTDVIPDNIIIEAPNGKYYDRNGSDMTSTVMPLLQNLNIDDAFLTDLFNEFIQQYENVVNPDNYTGMTRDEALARASEQLRSSYDQQLQNTLNKMNQNALATGFFGQLPTEALKQQAAAANEVDFQSAINDLANSLYDTSYNEAQTSLTNDRTMQSDQLSQLESLINAYRNYTTDQENERVNSLNAIANALSSMQNTASSIASQTAKNGTVGDISGLSDIYDRYTDYLEDLYSQLNS